MNNSFDTTAIKAKQQASWSSGNYAKVGSLLQITGENLIEKMALSAGESVLDVAAGNGNATLAAARRFCSVTSTDYVATLLQQGKERAVANGLDVTFQIADAEALPFESSSFNHAVSTFGVMFTPDQEKAANELLRVVQDGGSIGLANWTPNSFIGRLFGVIGKFVPPPQGVVSPANWGNADFVAQWFKRDDTSIDFELKHFMFRFVSKAHWLDYFKTYYGPIHNAFLALDVQQQELLAEEIYDLIDEFDDPTIKGLCVPSEYAEVIIHKHAAA